MMFQGWVVMVFISSANFKVRAGLRWSTGTGLVTRQLRVGGIEILNLLQQVKRGLRFFIRKDVKCETGMHQNIVTQLSFGSGGNADFLLCSSKIHFGHGSTFKLVDFDDLTWNTK